MSTWTSFSNRNTIMRCNIDQIKRSIVLLQEILSTRLSHFRRHSSHQGLREGGIGRLYPHLQTLWLYSSM